MSALVRHWWIFTRERFALSSHIPMVGLFSLGNMALATYLLRMEANFWSFPQLFALSFLFFFRLRCFDEIKDYEVDLKVNPTRPLARGILSVSQVKVMIALIAAIELLIASLGGLSVLAVHTAAMLYSFLMYKEFFIGRWLRPHLTTYAVTHTFVSILLGWSIAAQVNGQVSSEFFKAVIWSGPINWALFNLFEFARKTFAPAEERPTVESYSSLFGVRGAVVLSLSQIAIALAAIYTLSLRDFWIQGLCALLPLCAAIFLAMTRTAKAASLYRGLTGAYLLLFYVVLTYQSLAH